MHSTIVFTLYSGAIEKGINKTVNESCIVKRNDAIMPLHSLVLSSLPFHHH